MSVIFLTNEDKELVDSQITEISTKVGDEVDIITDFKVGRIDTSVGVGEVVDIDSIYNNSSYTCWATFCKRGDQFIITGYGGEIPRLWCFTDTNKCVLSVSAANAKTQGETLTAEADGYFIYNSSVNGGTDYTPAVTHTRQFSSQRNSERVGVIEKTINTALTEVRDITDFEIGHIPVDTGVGTTVDITWVQHNSAYVHKVISCKAGDKFTIVGFGADTILLWCFTDENYVILSAAEGKVYTKGMTLTAEVDGYFIYNSSVNAGTAYTPSIVQTVSFDPSREYSERQQLEKPTYLVGAVPSDYITFTSVQYNSTDALTLDEIYAGYDALVTQYPDYVTRTQLGTDTSGTYPIYRYDFTRPEIEIDMLDYNALRNIHAPRLIVGACIHGEEKPCARALLNVMTAIANAGTSNDALGWLRTNINFSIIPVVNPYGYVAHQRGNVNGVDLNRNFADQWENGSTEAGLNYKGTAALSESESQIIDNLLMTETAVAYLDLHTHGVFDSYAGMTYFPTSKTDRSAMQRVGFGVITELTKSGWANHDLPTDSGYIGTLGNPQSRAGRVTMQDRRWGIPTASPECMYRFYDGNTNVSYAENVNCMNSEFIANIFIKLVKEFIQ